ncbi:MAG TPA: hypothetical protein VIL99_01070 [Ignavibacteria bacterium]
MKKKINNNILTSVNIKKIESFFGAKFIRNDSSISANIKNVKSKTDISLELIIDGVKSILVSVYTNNSHFQLQSCDKFIISSLLGEVIFISKNGSKISGLIITKQGDCSLYSNVSLSSLRKNFANLNSEKLISAVALSVAETLY